MAATSPTVSLEIQYLLHRISRNLAAHTERTFHDADFYENLTTSTI